ncbi:MAG: hypothetical protein K2M78_12810 [Lachnospiraceae bacterium]|nr:hypothetical protein [Lachnospiraceae bacterium]
MIRTIFMSSMAIITTVLTCPKWMTVSVGLFGIGFDFIDLVSAADGDWSKVLGQIGAITIDAFSMGLLINDIHEDIMIHRYMPIPRNGDQKALIEITKEAVSFGAVTEDIKDILFEWAKQYDSFEDI